MQMRLSLEDSPVLWAAAFANVPTLPQAPAKPKVQRRRPALIWHDLKLSKPHHQGLVALVKLTNLATGEYFVHDALDVYTYMRQLDDQLRRRVYNHLPRLQELYDYAPDFHVQLITFAQYREGDSDERREFAWAQWREGCHALHQQLMLQGKDDPLFLNNRLRTLNVKFGDTWRYLAIAPGFRANPQAHQAEEVSYRKFSQSR